MAVAADHDVDRRPAGTDAADHMAQHQRYLGAVRRLAGAQNDRHRLPGGRFIDVDRLEAAAVVLSVEQPQLLPAMNPVYQTRSAGEPSATHRRQLPTSPPTH